MKTIRYEFNDGTVSEVEVSDEIYEVIKVEDRPFEREEKRKQRRGLSLEQFLEDNDFEIADDSQNPEIIIDRLDKQQTALRLKTLRQGMKTLSDKQASAIHKHFFLKMTYAEIANEEGVDKYTIRDRIQVALKKLNKFFQNIPHQPPISVQTYEGTFSKTNSEVTKWDE